MKASSIMGLPLGKQVLAACTNIIPPEHGSIHKFIIDQPDGCPGFEKGFFRETTGCICDKCNKGSIILQRSLENEKLEISFYCNNPECVNRPTSITINKLCRFCKNKLSISIQDGLICNCKVCGKHGVLYFAIHEWPSISPKDYYVHGSMACAICYRSERTRKSLFETRDYFRKTAKWFYETSYGSGNPSISLFTFKPPIIAERQLEITPISTLGVKPHKFEGETSPEREDYKKEIEHRRFRPNLDWSNDVWE